MRKRKSLVSTIAVLVFIKGRMYDYNAGRFLSVDPFIQDPGSTQSLNPYTYIFNNPLSGTDPSGYLAECSDDGTCDLTNIKVEEINKITVDEKTGEIVIHTQDQGAFSVGQITAVANGITTSFTFNKIGNTLDVSISEIGSQQEAFSFSLSLIGAKKKGFFEGVAKEVNSGLARDRIDPVVKDFVSAFNPSEEIKSAINCVTTLEGCAGTLLEVLTRKISKFGEALGSVKRVINSDTTSSAVKALPSPRLYYLEHVTDTKLKNRVIALYRRNARIGNGGTGDVIRHELQTGELLSPKGHFRKGLEMRKGLLDDLKSGRLNEQDTKIARQLLSELQRGLQGQ